MRSLLARVDRVLGCEPGEHCTREQDERIANEKALVAVVAPLIDDQLAVLIRKYHNWRATDLRPPLLAMQTYMKGLLAEWAGRVESATLVKVQCYAITAFYARARKSAVDPREIVAYEKSDPLMNRNSPYWDEAILFLNCTDRRSLAEFMRAKSWKDVLDGNERVE
jgi:hypothetical protein